MKRFFIFLLAFMLVPSFSLGQTTSLNIGSKGSRVTALQKRLNELEIASGTPDGIYGEKTAAAVMEAQRLLQAAGYDIEPTGTADESTLLLIHDEQAETALRTLRKGSKGSRVKALQERLIELGFLKEAADSVYGSMTESAVAAFQARMDLDAQDGVVSPEVWDFLMSDLKGTGIEAPVFFDETFPLALTPSYLYAPSFILIDAPSGQVLMEHNADASMYPASTTKIMTLMLALEKADLTQTVTIPPCAADIPADSSLTPVYPGEKIKMLDLLYGLMIRSGNDAANAVAELCSGSVEAFVAEMNTLARDLGMTNSHFCNPHGYHDANHFTTARDLSIAARRGLTDPLFCQVVTCMSHTMPRTNKRGELVLQNVWEIFYPDSEYFIPGAAGVKSGYTSAAGFCYVGAAQRDGQTLIAVVLGETTRNRAWIDLRRLFEYGFAYDY